MEFRHDEIRTKNMEETKENDENRQKNRKPLMKDHGFMLTIFTLERVNEKY